MGSELTEYVSTCCASRSAISPYPEALFTSSCAKRAIPRSRPSRLTASPRSAIDIRNVLRALHQLTKFAPRGWTRFESSSRDLLHLVLGDECVSSTSTIISLEPDGSASTRHAPCVIVPRRDISRPGRPCAPNVMSLLPTVPTHRHPLSLLWTSTTRSTRSIGVKLYATPVCARLGSSSSRSRPPASRHFPSRAHRNDCDSASATRSSRSTIVFSSAPRVWTR
ncbi:hypothetical protein EXIGLDRAFT_413270 [Exidia glandulosa HHB12029]|uniref:Uncharacterized protein n=1 Tax=Exidia glandulosa HHB12029 TaxID=1314781 RepID=A0A165BEY2_EXIGL|nr:hypothetical protein EXIGLDRAFT_413270 [Exidia glandulosa HHB12029]